MATVKVNTTENKINVGTTENKLTITNNNTGATVNISPTNTGTITVSAPGPAGPTGAAGTAGSVSDYSGTLSGEHLNLSGHITASGDLDVSGDVFVSQYIKHKGDINTAINFTDNKIKFEAGGMSFLSLYDDDSAPFTATVNNDSNRINFKVMDKNNDLLLKTDSDAYNVLLHHAGSEKLSTQAGGINVTGHVTASANISSSGDITANKFYVDQYIYHKDNNITYLNFTQNRLRFHIGGISYIDLNDETGPPRDITFNDGGNNVDLTIKGSSNNPLFKTDASANRIGTHGKGTPEVAFHIGGSELRVDGHISGSTIKIDGSQVDFTNLPTSDPGVAGRLWNDSNTVKISAG